ncbi:hypothetical protein ACQPYA_04235 [Micromonospora sp. CA-263727]|uniref:hypothetical protein n=1 Tax=Micromonospora sp. CA-263727 TaxID=3239967 RepID=UPI003D945506
MTSVPPAALHATRIHALVHELARAYLDRRADEVLRVDARLRDEASGAPGGLTREIAELMPEKSAAMMCQDHLRLTKSAEAELLPVAGQLAADAAPPALRDELALAFDRVAAGEATLFDRPAGLPGMHAHLYAAVVAAAIDRVHPMLHSHVRVKLEQDIRAARSVGRGIPAMETVAYISDDEAERVLLDVLPFVAEMTDPRHELIKMDLRALVKLYLLDHPVIGPREKSDLERRIGARLDYVTTAVGSQAARDTATAAPRSKTPATPLSPEQITDRQHAEKALRNNKGKRNSKRKRNRP